MEEDGIWTKKMMIIIAITFWLICLGGCFGVLYEADIFLREMQEEMQKSNG